MKPFNPEAHLVFPFEAWEGQYKAQSRRSRGQRSSKAEAEARRLRMLAQERPRRKARTEPRQLPPLTDHYEVERDGRTFTVQRFPPDRRITSA